MTLEHIFPRNPGNDWSNELKKFPGLQEEYLHKLGNLCLLQGQPSQQKSSNRGFSFKKEELYSKSNLTLTSQIAQTFHKWDPASIDDRQKELSKLALWRGCCHQHRLMPFPVVETEGDWTVVRGGFS